MHKQISFLLPTLVLAMVVTLIACTTVPDTNRRQINFLRASEEAALGISEFKKIKQEMKISTNPAYNAQVKSVGAKLAKVMPVANAEWEFVVFEDATPNAFALPGGKVGVNTGIFQITQNEAGLAAVMGHEVAHVVARHSGERLSRGALSAGAVALGTKVLGEQLGVNPDIASAGLGAGAGLKQLSHSRSQELEADRLGALYMARAGYHPEESVRLWQRFSSYRERAGGSATPYFLRTHPLDDQRISALREFLPKALSEYKPR